MENDAIERGVARLMVREHLSDLIRPEIGTEDQIIEMFMRAADAAPSARMIDVARAFRVTVNQFLLRRACQPPELRYRTL